MRWFRPYWMLLTVTCVAYLDLSCLPAVADDWLAEQTMGLVPAHGTYSNRQYGFRVTIPPGVPAWTTADPNPDHGLIMILGDHRVIDIQAAYDAALFGSTPELLQKRLQALPRGTAEIEIMVTRLGDSLAARATVNGPHPAVVIAQWRELPPNNAINYSVVLTTTNETRATDLRTFNAVLATYHHMPPER